MFYIIWNFIKSFFISLFKKKSSAVSEEWVWVLKNENEYPGNPFGTVVDWPPQFVAQCTTSNGITWPKDTRADPKFETLIKKQDRLIKKHKPKEPLRLYLSKKLIKYFSQARSFIYDTTDYIFNFIAKPKKIKHEPNFSVVNFTYDEVVEYEGYKELSDNRAWYQCVNFYESFENTYINLNKSYYVANGWVPILKEEYQPHHENLYLHKTNNVLIKCDDFNKFEHFLLFLRYEINIAINTQKSKNMLDSITNEFKKANSFKLSFFTSKNTFKNIFKKCLTDDYNFYFNSYVGEDMHKLPLSMFFKQAEDKEEVLTYKMFNIYKSFNDDELLNKFNVGYRFNCNEDVKLLTKMGIVYDRRVNLHRDFGCRLLA